MESETSDMGEEYSEGLATEQRMARAVRMQSKDVSKNTSHIPESPAENGVRSEARAWARDDVPQPASFDKIPRQKPSENCFRKICIPIPNAADLGFSASRIIKEITLPKDAKFAKIAAKHRNM